MAASARTGAVGVVKAKFATISVRRSRQPINGKKDAQIRFLEGPATSVTLIASFTGNFVFFCYFLFDFVER